jgi:hypothetical protein
MRKYTQRELINEAFRDKLKGMASVVGKGVLGAAKNVAKYISPEVYGLAKSAKGIYDEQQSYKTIVSYIASNRVIDVYDKSVIPEDIILSRFRRKDRGAIKTNPYRLSDPDSFKLKERRGEITITYFNATNYATKGKEWFVAYIFRDKDEKYSVFAIQSYANPSTPSTQTTPSTSGTGSSSAGAPTIRGSATSLPTATLATGTNTGSSGAGIP